MARLRSEDSDFESSLSITPGKTFESQGQNWQMIELSLVSGQRRLDFCTDSKQEPRAAMQAVSPEELAAAVVNQARVANAYMICRKPADEPLILAEKLQEMVTGTRTRLLFEPSEPSFELAINNIAGGLRVQLFIDAGNVETGIYRWDSLGVRFFTNTAHLQSFIDELKADFNC